MNLKGYLCLSETNRKSNKEVDLKIFSSGRIRICGAIVRRYKLDSRNMISVYAYNNIIVLVCGLTGDKKLCWSTNDDRCLYIKNQYQQLVGEYRLIDTEVEENLNKVYLKFSQLDRS